MKIIAVTQARYGSTRLPAKILKRIGEETLLDIHLQRILKSKMISKLIVATTVEEGSEQIVRIAKSNGVDCYRGSINDVLERFYFAVESLDPDYVVRITSDCPLIDSNVIDQVIKECIDSGVDYASNTLKPTFPDGIDVEVFKFLAMKKAFNEAILKSDREHVTPYIKKNSSFNGGVLFSSINIEAPFDCSEYRITVDTIEDFEVIKKLVENIGKDEKWEDYVKYLNSNINIKALNNNHKRDEGYAKSLLNDLKIMGLGQELYLKAKKLIPGGTMLLSKRPEQFLPDNWPSYYSKSKGCHIWDLDGKEYIDCSMMGIGTNTLGYANEEVDEAVIKVVRDGNLTTLNCPEEVYLAEKLIEMNPWAGGVRYTRGGGEANSVCVRIARAFSGKDKIAICGYHGWHDWYVSVNLGETDALAGHLLPGIPPIGVPKGLRGSTIPFRYNNYEELLDIVNHNDLAAIKMEVCRNFGPENNFLQKIRNLATERGIVLIFDECTSGFRETYGGLFEKYNVEPDMAIYSKTIGNGYAISAVVGRKDIMNAAQKTWISSTFWTERIGPTAALATLKVMERIKSWEIITEIGNNNKKRWQSLADKYGLEIEQWGIPALAGYTFKSENCLAYKTFITQEMLKKGYLAGTSLYPCIDHTPEILDNYFNELDGIFAQIRDFEDGKDVIQALNGPICQSGFKRLN